MKKSLLYMAMTLAGAAALTGCEGDLEYPPMIEPVATIEANTKIADLKAMYWQTDADYVTEVGQNVGHDIIIAGRVTSSDATGNIYKNIVLQDNTGAITISINGYDLYETYQQGQQVVVNVTGLHIGGYVGLMQIGAPGTSNKGVPQTTFLDKDVFAAHAQQNGLARLERLDTATVTIPDMATAKGSVEGLQKWQSRLVRVEGVSFVDAGQPFAGTANANRYVKDANGNQLNVRNSSYADFSNDILPAGSGTVTGILSYYNNDWQLLLNGLDGLEGFDWSNSPGSGSGDTPGGDTPAADAEGDGSEASPYNVAGAIAAYNKGVTGNVWVHGYIVGNTPSAYASDALFGAVSETTTAANIILGQSTEGNTADNTVFVQLVSGSDVRAALNLLDNPGNLNKEVWLYGSLEKYFAKPGIKSTSAYSWDGAGNVGGGGDTPTPSETTGYKAVTTVTSGKSYVIVAGGKIAKPLASAYGYLMSADVTVTDGTVQADPANAFTIEAVQGGYTIRDSNGKYLYQTGTYNSFNVDATMPADGAVWTITFDGTGAAVITNVSVSKSIQYDPNYTSYGSYPDVRGTYPTLYEKVS